MKWFKKSKKKKLDQDTSKDQDWNKDLKRNNYSPNSAEQIGLHLKEKPHYNTDLEDLSPKNVLSCYFKKLSLDQHHILKKCKLESDADELMKILKRTNKIQFQELILDPLVECGFFKESSNENFLLTDKKLPSCNFEHISSDQVQILRNCEFESSADELMKILKRTNKSRFKNDILNPLIKCDFFERTILDKPKSPNQKYRLTSKFVRAKLV